MLREQALQLVDHSIANGRHPDSSRGFATALRKFARRSSLVTHHTVGIFRMLTAVRLRGIKRSLLQLQLQLRLLQLPRKPYCLGRQLSRHSFAAAARGPSLLDQQLLQVEHLAAQDRVVGCKRLHIFRDMP
jgi:hypothetical protein